MQYSAWAADGQGVDRHLFGLKKSLQPGEDVPALYTDEAFAKSSHWELSTSQLSSPWFDGWGYGEGECRFLPSWFPPSASRPSLPSANFCFYSSCSTLTYLGH